MHQRMLLVNLFILHVFSVCVLLFIYPCTYNCLQIIYMTQWQLTKVDFLSSISILTFTVLCKKKMCINAFNIYYYYQLCMKNVLRLLKFFPLLVKVVEYWLLVSMKNKSVRPFILYIHVRKRNTSDYITLLYDGIIRLYDGYELWRIFTYVKPTTPSVFFNNQCNNNTNTTNS